MEFTSFTTAPMNPNWYGAWMGGMASPQSYGPTMNSLIRVPAYGAPMPMMVPMPIMPGAPVVK